MGKAAGQLAHGFHLLGLAQGLLRRLLTGEVVDNAGKVHPPIHLEFADGQMHGEGRAIAPPTGDFTADADDLAHAGCKVIGDIAVMRRVVWLGHQEMDIAPDELVLGIVEQACRCRIDRGDDAAAIDGDDGIDRRFEHGLQLAGLPDQVGMVWLLLGHNWTRSHRSLGTRLAGLSGRANGPRSTKNPPAAAGGSRSLRRSVQRPRPA